jgi:Asp-tRNA(Asn)/Glu-tRNA(Gln) amidotransferase A subunit family amidase
MASSNLYGSGLSGQQMSHARSSCQFSARHQWWTWVASSPLKQPVTQAITVKFVLSAGEYLHERYHGRLYAKAQNLRGGLRTKYDSMLQKVDALVMPSTPMKKHRRKERSPHSMLTNAAPFDVTGHPGLSVPCGMSNGRSA